MYYDGDHCAILCFVITFVTNNYYYTLIIMSIFLQIEESEQQRAICIFGQNEVLVSK